MDKEQKDTRYFLIEHKDCGSVLIVNTTKHEDLYSQRMKSGIEFLKCPSCGTKIIEDYELMQFFEYYRRLSTEKLAKTCTMREIQFRDLEAIKKPPNPPK